MSEGPPQVKSKWAIPLLVFAFSCFGFLIGNLVGLTAESVVMGLLPLLFAFGGGSAIALMGKLSEAGQVNAYIAIGCLSLSCLFGAYTGIYLTEHQVFTPENRRIIGAKTNVEYLKYLRSEMVGTIQSIDERARTKRISYEQAYKELKDAIEQSE